jgi:hypothetical protein
MCRKGAREQGRTPSWTGRFCREQRRRPHSFVLRGRSKTGLVRGPPCGMSRGGRALARVSRRRRRRRQWPSAVSLVDRLCHQVRLSRPCKVESTTTTTLPTLSVQRRESRHYWHRSITRPPVRERWCHRAIYPRRGVPCLWCDVSSTTTTTFHAEKHTVPFLHRRGRGTVRVSSEDRLFASAKATVWAPQLPDERQMKLRYVKCRQESVPIWQAGHWSASA